MIGRQALLGGADLPAVQAVRGGPHPGGADLQTEDVAGRGASE